MRDQDCLQFLELLDCASGECREGGGARTVLRRVRTCLCVHLLCVLLPAGRRISDDAGCLFARIRSQIAYPFFSRYSCNRYRLQYCKRNARGGIRSWTPPASHAHDSHTDTRRTLTQTNTYTCTVPFVRGRSLTRHGICSNHARTPHAATNMLASLTLSESCSHPL